MMTTDKYGCRALAGILHGHGVEYAVLCPGSRNVPLVMAFAREQGLKCDTAVDERSAAFIALGHGIARGCAVAVVCTSGTALLNMAPAVAEAYYRNVPLIVVSADRPGRWIDQADSQTIRQRGLLDNIVKRSYNIVAEAEADESRWFIDRTVNDAVITAMSGTHGPVHINVEIDSPLNREVSGEESYRIIRRAASRMSLSDEARNEISRRMLACRKVLVLGGCMAPNDRLNRGLIRLVGNGNVAVAAEPLANVSVGIRNIEAALCRAGKLGRESMVPDLLITLGGAIVSDTVKRWLRENAPAEHWHIGRTDNTVDTFKCLTERIDMEPADFFAEISVAMRREEIYGGEGSDYGASWARASDNAYMMLDQEKAKAGWCEISALDEMVKMLPPDANVQLSNGMTVRYYEWVSRRRAHRADCNRGVSGIDGSTSTAIGAATAYSGMTVLITGDMSAQYDIGALASLRLINPKGKFKMVVMANGGGNIFKYVKNTRGLAETEDYLYNSVDTDWNSVGKAYGMAVFEASDMESLGKQADRWLGTNDRSAMLVVRSDAEKNARVMLDLVNGK